MPYITNDKRQVLDPYIAIILEDDPYKFSEKAYDACRAVANEIEVAGDLNYTISKIVWTVFARNPRYATADKLINDLEELKVQLVTGTNIYASGLTNKLHAICCRADACKSLFGTIMCVELEFYRRIVGPYEDKAIAKNGDLEVTP